MVDDMTTTDDPRRTWSVGYLLLLTTPFIGLGLTFTDSPRWLQIIGVLAIVICVGVGATMLRREDGGWWRPSETLGRRGDDER